MKQHAGFLHSDRGLLAAILSLSLANGAFAQRHNHYRTRVNRDKATTVVRASEQPAGKPHDGEIATFEATADFDGMPAVSINESALTDALSRTGRVVIGRVPLRPNQSVALEVEPLRVIGPETRIVVGRPGGVDEPFLYDVSQVHLFQGTVLGHPESSVVISWTPRGIRGHIDLGPTNERYLLSTVDVKGRTGTPKLAVIRPVKQDSQSIPDVPMCGLPPISTVAGCCFEPPSNEVFSRRLATVEIAVETDFDLFENFGDLTAETDYLVELIARTSAIYLRDMDTRFEIVFMRLFDNAAAEPAFMNNPDPLNGFVNFWSANMGTVHRDTASFLSGRRDLPYGGIAYLNAICSTFAYSVCGYLSGFPDPNAPNAGDYDLGVVVHELGHNFGACHTPDYCPPMDRCYPPPVSPQRGSLMSYCSQTVSGGNLMTDLWFHTRLRRVMRSFLETQAFCVTYDCNLNGVDDALDIAEGAQDADGNGIPDECEDCNENGVLDSTDIAESSSLDLNSNGIPDDCEPDCNGNGSPDDRDIFLRDSFDLWGNGVPDECDSDCDENGDADYNQIQLDLTLDIDRNVVLDSCQDCDGDGTNDLVELMGARNAWVASDVLNYIGEYHAISGVRVKKSTVGLVSAAQDLIIAPGNRVLVTSAANNSIVAYDAVSGAYLGDFVTAGGGGLSYPTGLVIGPNGNLFVSSRNTNSVSQFDGSTGTFVGEFVPSGLGGLVSPFGLTFGPNGNLFVTCGGIEVLEYNGNTGSFVRLFVSAANNGGLSGARGMLFKPDGNLLVASYDTDALLQFDGTTGAFLGKWNSGGTDDALYLDGPWGIRIGPSGNVFATRDLPAFDHHGDKSGATEIAALHVTSARIMEFDIRDGKYVRAFIVGDDTELRSTTGFDFMDGTFDCNFNMLPDNCDIADQTSADCDENGVPDECEAIGFDCNNNLVRDACDISAETSQDIDENGIPDECEANVPPMVVADPGTFAESRFISFGVPSFTAGSPIETAIRVRLTSLHHVDPPYTGGPSVPFTSFEGQVRWVGPPTSYIESTSDETPFTVSALQCASFYTDWSTVGLLHVTGAEVVPSSFYSVENVAAVCVPNEAGCAAVSAALTMTTTRWGDVVEPFNPPSNTSQPDFGDIAALVNKFKSAAGAPTKARTLLAGINANGVIDPSPDLGFTHISAGVDAFKGSPYPYTIAPCP